MPGEERSAEVIVLGLGAMGSATSYQLARRGVSVIGIDQHHPPHRWGSSHGDTRITRLAVGEGAIYAPLVRRSHEIWRSLEDEASVELLVACGGLIMGVEGAQGQHGADDFLGTTKEVARSSGIDHELLDAAEISRRYPAFEVTDETGYFEPEAGYLLAERCVSTQLELASRAGATLHVDTTVQRWRATDRGVEVETSAGVFTGDVLVVAAGPWVEQLVPELAGTVEVQRQVLYWFDIDHGLDALAALPIFVWMHSLVPGDFLYGFPAIDGPSGGLKLATEQRSAPTSPADVERTVSDAEVAAMFESHVEGLIDGLAPRCVRTAVCLYTSTPDSRFIIDHHPAHENVLVASPCSGHGFKHSAAIGEVLAELATGGLPTIDVAPFGFHAR